VRSTFDKKMKNKVVMWGCLIPIIGILLLPFVGYGIKELTVSDGRKALPKDAANIEEDLVHGIIGGDYTRRLKASLPPERYSDYARSLHLFERFDPEAHHRIESILNMTGGDAPVWWNPPKVDSATYFEHKEGDDYLKVLRYHNGSVYLLEQRW
jgi:hypothetical protein